MKPEVIQNRRVRRIGYIFKHGGLIMLDIESVIEVKLGKGRQRRKLYRAEMKDKVRRFKLILGLLTK